LLDYSFGKKLNRKIFEGRFPPSRPIATVPSDPVRHEANPRSLPSPPILSAAATWAPLAVGPLSPSLLSCQACRSGWGKFPIAHAALPCFSRTIAVGAILWPRRDEKLGQAALTVAHSHATRGPVVWSLCAGCPPLPSAVTVFAATATVPTP
jgi:hypothetical protein